MGTTICIVEDDILIAEDVRDQLTRLGYDVCSIMRDAEEALRLIPEKKPDLVLMDILLKGKMSGVQAAAIFEKKHQIPVIFLTGVPKEQIENASLSDPCNYLPKPFSDEDLKECIENALKFYQCSPPDGVQTNV